MERAVRIIAGSRQMCGYDVRIWNRGPFRIRGYTLIVQPGKRGSAAIPRFSAEVEADGRLGRLKAASSAPTWMLGLGSWDPACPKGGQRYTICIEESGHTDFSRLEATHELFAKDIGASEWMCFEIPDGRAHLDRFWKDDPYKMMGPLGYRFHMGGEGDFSIGLHFDAYPPGFDSVKRPAMEFWITVAKA